MNKVGKDNLRVAYAEKFNKANAAVIAEYRGLSVEELTELRRSMRELDAEFQVLKNRVAVKALVNEAKECGDIAEQLKGPIGIAYLFGDPAQAAKSLLKFEKEHEHFVVKSGLMEKKAVSVSQIKAIADLPSKEVLLAQIVGSLVSPHRGLLGVMNGVARNLVQVINAIKDKKA